MKYNGNIFKTSLKHPQDFLNTPFNFLEEPLKHDNLLKMLWSVCQDLCVCYIQLASSWSKRGTLTLRANAPAKKSSLWPIRSLRDILAGVYALKVSAPERMSPFPFFVKLSFMFTRFSHTVVVYVTLGIF